MSCCFEQNAKDQEQRKISRSIDRRIKKEKQASSRKIKLLLLGSGDAGKSTFAKQMRLLHQHLFTDEELHKFKNILQRNAIDNMRVLINGCLDRRIQLRAENQISIDVVSTASSLTPEVSRHIQALWKDPGIRQMYSRANELPRLGCQSDYYFDHAARFASSGFVQTEEDVVRAKIKTTGIKETVFTAGNLEFTMVDVGGQRTERRKWFHCFENVTAVIFLASLDAYDLSLEEDENTNRMHESLKLFQEISSSEWFTSTSFILFLNKKDLFEEKIAKKPLGNFYKDYKGGADYDSAVKYVSDLYKMHFRHLKQKLFTPYITCAIDRDNIRRVFDAVKSLLLKETLGGILPYATDDLV